MTELRREIGFALRSLVRRPSYCAVVILTLALGIGANSAIFSVIRTVLLEPLPYREPERLAMIWSRWRDVEKSRLSPGAFLDFQAMDRPFEDVALWTPVTELALTGEGDAPEGVNVARMTANLLPVLGITPLHGRAFTSAEDAPGGPRVAMMGHDLWRRRYGAEASVVGRSIRIDGEPVQVVGILPPGFRFPTEFQSVAMTQVVFPARLDRSTRDHGNHGYYAIARLRPGVDAARATTAIGSVTRRWAEEGIFPASLMFTAFAVSLREEVSGGVSLALEVLSVAGGLLLLLTCMNVASIVLTRAEGRSREAAVRAALGANRWRLLRLPVLESVLLGLAGGVVGLGLADATVKVLVARAPATLPRLGEVIVDVWVAGFTLLLSIVAGVAVGLVPARRVARVDLAEALREGSRGQSGGTHRRRGRALLVTAEMALAVLLVIAAGLTVRSYINLQTISPGFDARSALTLRLSLSPNRHPSPERVVDFYRRLEEEVGHLPNVEAAGFVLQLPLVSEIGPAGIQIEAKPVLPGHPAPQADWQVATPGYFRSMGTPLVRGRFFGPEDVAGANPVIIVNESLVRQYFPGEDPIGRRILYFSPQMPYRTIVGVVRDVRHNGVTRPVSPAFFVPHSQWHDSPGGRSLLDMTLVVRTSGDPARLLARIEEVIRRVDPDLPLTHIATLEEVVAAATREQRFTAALMSGFALLALVLAAVGIYGVISWSVSQRTREIGIRLALGARDASIRALVIRQGLRPAAVGIVMGLGAAAWLTRYLGSLLHGVEPTDALTFTMIPMVLLLVAGGSVLIPATRASRMAPVEALRHD